jgi:hypothetical protein
MQTTNQKHLIKDCRAVVDIIDDYGQRNAINVNRVIDMLCNKMQIKIFKMHKYEGEKNAINKK